MREESSVSETRREAGKRLEVDGDATRTHASSNPRSPPYSPKRAPIGPMYQVSAIPTTAPATPQQQAKIPAIPTGRSLIES